MQVQFDSDAGLVSWNSPDWEASLRLKLQDVPGPCVLDVAPEVILSFPQGDWRLVEQDLVCGFGECLAAEVTRCLRDQVVAALAVRRELINFKKLCLHLWQSGIAIEKDLRQCSSFFYCDLVDDKDSLRFHDIYTDVACGMNECHGAVLAIHDARYFGKLICNLPRHPISGVPWKLDELPKSLEVWKSLHQAKQFICNHKALDQYWAARWRQGPLEEDLGTSIPEHGDDRGYASQANVEATPATKPEKSQIKWQSERKLVSSKLGEDCLHVLLGEVKKILPALPSSALRYIELVLIARGAIKALTIGKALQLYCSALERTANEVEETMVDLEALMALPASETSLSAGLHLHAEKYRRVLVGVHAVIPELLRWLRPILVVDGASERLFLSGARGAAAFVPRGFPDLLQPYRNIVIQHRETMLMELASNGWPRASRPRQEEELRLHACRKCTNSYTKLWVHRSLCFSCEGGLRNEGRCPFNDRCGERSFCPHDRRCIVCEQWSCEQCGLLRGDGEDVWQLTAQVQPAVIFLDFDRTLATTKAGASPLQGNHAVDPDLAAVCSGYGHVQIVTRSSRKEDIETFLSSKGVPVERVCSLKREGFRNKGDAIIEVMKDLPGELGIFVDDDIRELTDCGITSLVAEGRLKRILFVRAGGKE